MSEDLISRAAVMKMLREKAESCKPSMFDTESECSIAKIVAIEKPCRKCRTWSLSTQQ